MAGLVGNSRGASIRVGVQTAADVNVAPSPPASRLTMLDTDSASTWALCLFLFAVVMLYIIL